MGVDNCIDIFGIERWKEFDNSANKLIQCVIPICIYNVITTLIYYFQMIIFNNLVNSSEKTLTPTVILIICKQLIIFKGKTNEGIMAPVMLSKIDSFINHLIFFLLIYYLNNGITGKGKIHVFFYFLMNFVFICKIFIKKRYSSYLFLL